MPRVRCSNDARETGESGRALGDLATQWNDDARNGRMMPEMAVAVSSDMRFGHFDHPLIELAELRCAERLRADRLRTQLAR